MVQCSLVHLKETPTIGIRKVVPIDELPTFFGDAYGRLFEVIGQDGLTVTNPPLAHYYGMPTDLVDVEAAVPIAEPYDGSADVVAGTLPPADAVEALHFGPYDTLTDTYEQVAAWMSERGFTPGYDMWEFYLTDATLEPDPAKWETKVVWPIA